MGFVEAFRIYQLMTTAKNKGHQFVRCIVLNNRRCDVKTENDADFESYPLNDMYAQERKACSNATGNGCNCHLDESRLVDRCYTVHDVGVLYTVEIHPSWFADYRDNR